MWRHADTGIGNAEADQRKVVLRGNQTGSDDNGALLGEFYGITDQIQQDLSGPQLIAPQDIRHIIRYVGLNHKFFMLNLKLLAGKQLPDATAQGKVAVFQFQFAGLDLRQVKDVADQGRPAVSRTSILSGNAPARRYDGCLQQVRHADNPVHRGTDFMAHVGKKCALGGVRRLSRLLG